MNLRPEFLNQIKRFNGQSVQVEIVMLDAATHPLGPFGAMMMGQESAQETTNAIRHYKSKSNPIRIAADMEIVSGSNHLIFVNNEFACNCIEVFRPSPPMIVSGADMSLWWAFHPLTPHEMNKLSLLKGKYKPSNSDADGSSFPIRDVVVNGISHCLY